MCGRRATAPDRDGGTGEHADRDGGTGEHADEMGGRQQLGLMLQATFNGVQDGEIKSVTEHLWVRLGTPPPTTGMDHEQATPPSALYWADWAPFSESPPLSPFNIQDCTVTTITFTKNSFCSPTGLDARLMGVYLLVIYILVV
ncbi:Serine/Threonine-Protein Phosphatase 6 Regulatory Ankyrin Repeat Subunit C [Manis pentadactyla]|nr:Serine/Threonine-Protein Phosphatase 6 Regulatory Ankyrin Repeat Subunit C [Manis pentadactyla]